MSDHTSRNAVLAERPRVAPVEIEVADRWDALALAELLIPYHSFLVQLDHQRWVVHARTPGSRGGSLDDALGTIEHWLTERGLEGSTCRVGGRPYELRS